MKMKTTATMLILLVTLLGVGSASPSRDRAEVKAFLHARLQWSLGKSNKQVDVKNLKHLGTRTLRVLADFLPDYNLGDTAADVMLEIDSRQAAPLIFRSMPKSDRNVQGHTFIFYIRQIRSGQKFLYAREMHNAAVRCLNANTEADAAEQALLAIGLTGSRRDFPLLTRYYNSRNPDEMWKLNLRNAAEASLARLGSKKHLDAIAHQLRVPIPAQLTFEWAWQLSESIRKAAFSHNRRFVPLLCKHLDTPTPQITSDTMPQQPSQEAANALGELLHNAPPDNYESIEYWKKWYAKSYSKQQRLRR